MEYRDYSIDLELETRVNDVLSVLGTDVNSLFKSMLEKIANNELTAKDVERIMMPRKDKIPFEELGGIFPKIWIADDFDEPMDLIIDDMLEDPLC